MSDSHSSPGGNTLIHSPVERRSSYCKVNMNIQQPADRWLSAVTGIKVKQTLSKQYVGDWACSNNKQDVIS